MNMNIVKTKVACFRYPKVARFRYYREEVFVIKKMVITQFCGQAATNCSTKKTM